MKILLIHATAGAGHQKAAEAVYDGLKKNASHQVTIIDALDYTNPLFKKTYRDSYAFLVSKLPKLWGFVFELIDIPWLQPLVRFCRRIYNSLNTQKLQKFLEDEQFDYIISTHFLANEVVSALKRTKKIRSKLIGCVTDFDVHKIWLGSGVDMYCVACMWTHERLRRQEVSEDRILITGIPTNEKFSQQRDRVELKQQLGLSQDAFTVLIATGSFGFGPIEEIILALKNFQVVVVCGHNKHLFERLQAKKLGWVKVCGLVNNMHELMAVSDAMVTKPGGLSISEALVSQLPLIFFNAIPGQEENNVKVLKRCGIGISGCTIPQIVEELEKMRASRDVHLTAVKRTNELARPLAVKDIINLIK